MLIGSLTPFFAPILLFAGFFLLLLPPSPSSLATAQQTTETTTGATTIGTTDQSAATTSGGSTNPITFTLRMEDQGAGEAGVSSSPTTSAATSSSNLSTRNIGIDVNIIRSGNEAAPAIILLPINVTIPANVNNLELCASSPIMTFGGAAEKCEPVLHTIDLTQSETATATDDTTASGTTTSPFSSPSSSSSPTIPAPPTTSSPPATTAGGGTSLIDGGGIEDGNAAVMIPITVIAPITADIQNAQLCAQLVSSGVQSCNQIILNPQQTSYTPVNVDMTTSPTPIVISSSAEVTGTTTTATGATPTTTGITDTGGGTTSSSSTTTTITTPTTPPTTTTPPGSTNDNSTTTTDTTTGGGGGTTSTLPSTTPPGGLKNITATANPAIYNGVHCPSPLQFTGTITDNVGNRDVTYRFIFSTGATTPVETIHFDQPGSQSVSYKSPGIAPPSLEGFVAIQIMEPGNEQPVYQSGQAEMRIICTTGISSGGITASLSANPSTYNGPCPARIDFTGTITDNVGNRDVTYRFIRSDGAIDTQEKIIHFDQPGSQTVSDTWQIGKTSQGWKAIEILQPVQLQSNKAEFQIITCTPSTGGAAPGGSSGSGGGITASLSANPATSNGPCPVSVNFGGTITDNVGNRDVRFRINQHIIFDYEPSQGVESQSTGTEQVIHFDQPGSQSVDNSGLNADASHGWAVIEILQPVQLQSNRAEFQITCPPNTGAAQTLQEGGGTTEGGGGGGTTEGGGGGGTTEGGGGTTEGGGGTTEGGGGTTEGGGGDDDAGEPQ